MAYIKSDDKEWLKNISKRDFSLAPSKLDMRGVPSQCEKVGSQFFSWDGDYNANVHKEGF